MVDPYKLAAMRILVKVITPVYVMNPGLLGVDRVYDDQYLY
jgi:hypothetical protein